MKDTYMIRLLVLVSFMILSSCMTTRYYKNDEIDFSLGEIKQTFFSMVGNPRLVSENDRELESPYFSRRKESPYVDGKSPERLYAKLYILGDRRPYTLEIHVFVEKRTGKEYEQSDESKEHSERLGLELVNRLTQMKQKRNVIDDFRVF